MDTSIEKIRVSANEYISELQKVSKFSNIAAQVDFTETTEKKGISFSSNAGMWLSNSNSFVKELYTHLEKEYMASGCNTGIVAKISLSKANQKPSKNSKDESVKELAQFSPEKPKYKLEDVILPEETYKSIEEAISSINNFDMVYNQWNFKSKEPSAKTNICFFGAPGTGKTMCAHAIANKLGKQILIASYADIQSQYVGVGPKNLKEVFRQAEESDAVLFFDEADAFLRKRTSDNSNAASMHYNSMTNEMMKHLEDFNGIVIFATNLTENTDEAFKTRLSFSIEFKVPDESCRAKIIKGMIPNQVPLATDFTEDDYTEMSKTCEGMVGRDIRNSVKTILSVGAQKHEYPFTKEQFIDGFKNYKENKASFDKNGKKDGANPMDIYTANGCIHNLLTYAAWIDGKETDKESEYLKLFSKILNRNKLIINSVSDLPEFEELCHEIKDDSLKKKAMRYLAYFMAYTEQKDELFEKISGKLKNDLSLSDDYMTDLNSYYNQQKSIANGIYEKIK